MKATCDEPLGNMFNSEKLKAPLRPGSRRGHPLSPLLSPWHWKSQPGQLGKKWSETNFKNIICSCIKSNEILKNKFNPGGERSVRGTL